MFNFKLFTRKRTDLDSKFKAEMTKGIFSFEDAKQALVSLGEYSKSNIQSVLNSDNIVEVGDSYYAFR